MISIEFRRFPPFDSHSPFVNCSVWPHRLLLSELGTQFFAAFDDLNSVSYVRKGEKWRKCKTNAFAHAPTTKLGDTNLGYCSHRCCIFFFSCSRKLTFMFLLRRTRFQNGDNPASVSNSSSCPPPNWWKCERVGWSATVWVSVGLSLWCGHISALVCKSKSYLPTIILIFIFMTSTDFRARPNFH